MKRLNHIFKTTLTILLFTIGFTLIYWQNNIFAQLQSADSTMSLHLAIEAGEIDLVKTMIKDGEKLEIKDRDGATPLITAAKNGQSEIASILINAGANTNASDQFGSTALIYFTRQPDTSIIMLLLQHNADINEKDEIGFTALHHAILNKNENVANILVEEKADIHVNSKQKYTPLMAACETGQIKMVKLLVGRGAAIDEMNKEWDTPMTLASRGGHLETIQFLLDSNADITFKSQGWRSLYEASRLGHIKIAKLFILLGIDVNLRSKKTGWTALLAACAEGQRDVALMLIENGANVHARTKNKYSTLMGAAKNGLTDVAHILIEKGVDINGKCILPCQRWAPLTLACSNGAPLELVELLLQNGADIDLKSGPYGMRAYHWAFKNDHDELGKYLISKGTEIKKHDNSGEDCYATAKAYRTVALSFENAGDTTQTLENYFVAEEYFEKGATKMMKLAQDYATGFERGVGASIFSSLVGTAGVIVDMKNLQKGKQTNWRDIAPDVEVEKIEANKKLQEEYEAKSAKCKQLAEECREHIDNLQKAGSKNTEE